MSITISSKTIGLISCVLWLGCSSDAAPAASDHSGAEQVAPAAPAEPAPAAAAAGPVVEDPTFTLAATGSAAYTANTLGQFSVTLTPKGEYHVNEEYPITIQVVAPDAVKVAKADLAKADAAEVTATTARFDIPVTPTTAGEHRVQAKVSFAVCTPENCMPDERTLELALLVQ